MTLEMVMPCIHVVSRSPVNHNQSFRKLPPQLDFLFLQRPPTVVLGMDMPCLGVNN